MNRACWFGRNRIVETRKQTERLIRHRQPPLTRGWWNEWTAGGTCRHYKNLCQTKITSLPVKHGNYWRSAPRPAFSSGLFFRPLSLAKGYKAKAGPMAHAKFNFLGKAWISAYFQGSAQDVVCSPNATWPVCGRFPAPRL